MQLQFPHDKNMLEKGKIRVKDIKFMKIEEGDADNGKICNEIFLKEENHVDHQKEDNIYEYKYTFEEHLKQYVCRTCKAEFKTVDEIEKHIEIHEEKLKYTFESSLQQYICSTCKAEFKTVDEIEKHIEIHEKKYECTFCTNLFSDPFQYAVHLFTHTKNTYNCPLCSMKTAHRNSLYNHINKMHLRKYYLYCKYCGKGFNDNLYLKEHLEMHETGLQQICVVCKREFTYSRYLYLHQIRYHRVNISGARVANQCEICHKVFAKASYLERHIKMGHEKSTTIEKKSCGLFAAKTTN